MRACPPMVAVLALSLAAGTCKSPEVVRAPPGAGTLAAVATPPVLSAAGRTDAPAAVDAGLSPGQPPTGEVTTGLVSIGENFQSALAFAANGLWFASFVRGGVLLGDSQTGRPLALAPFNYDKAAALAFHPASRHLVVVVDFSLLVLAIEGAGEAVRLRRAEVLPEPLGGLGLLPPAFDHTVDHTGRTLAIAGHQTATLYDWDQRRPLCHIAPELGSSWVMGFSRDTLYFVEPFTRPCKCDDYRGGSAGIASFRLGGRTVHNRWPRDRLESPLHLRQGKVATGQGVWDVRTGRPRVRYRLDAGAHLVHVFRLRAQAASVGVLLRRDQDAQELVVLGDDGRLRDLGKLPETPSELAVRPQDDLAMYWGFDRGRNLIFIRLADGHVEQVAYPDKVCVDDGQVVPAERCPRDGAELALPDLEASSGDERELPTYAPPPSREGQARREPREGDIVEDEDGVHTLRH
jgi:hypothetical protein